MPTVGDALEREHREIDEHIEAFRAGLAAGEWRIEDLSRGAAALRRHIFIEEAQLFPLLREAGLFRPVAVMVREHGEIWEALDELEASSAGPEALPAAHALERLTKLLDAHNLKEEGILYPAADRLLQPAAVEQLRSFLQQGALPDGWVCEARRSEGSVR